MQVAIVIYPGMTALDVLGPYEVFHVAGWSVRFVWKAVGPVVADSGVLVVGATHTFAETTEPDIVLVGGSSGDTMTLAADSEVLEWLRAVRRTLADPRSSVRIGPRSPRTGTSSHTPPGRVT
ncbi:MAG: DJ-1/PfpI family protein [Proteobacteria bacterium]|nr:DJ-1/PfpI family protein [Pseudomonadota bacterium]